MKTLDAFLKQHLAHCDGVIQFPANAYVRIPGFKSSYVRVTQRFIEGHWYTPVLDLANQTALHPGKGAFTALIKHLRLCYPTLNIFVECVVNERFHKKLESLGFTRIGVPERPEIPPHYWLPA